MAGKGDKPRISSYSTYRANFDRINWTTKRTQTPADDVSSSSKGESGRKTSKKECKVSAKVGRKGRTD